MSQSLLEDRGYEDYVLKLSKGKCFFNRRYLILRNSIISYYQEKPADNSAKPARCKGRVHILETEIKRVDRSFNKKKSNPYMFQISHVPPGKSKKTFWVFAVTTQDNLQQWMEAFERSRSPVMAIYEEVEEESNDLEKESESKELQEQMLREENFKRNLELEKQRAEKKKKEIEEAKKFHEIEQEVRRKEEEKRKKKLEKVEKSKMKRNRKLLEAFWDFAMQELLRQAKGDLVEAGLKIFQLLGSFHEAAVQAAKVLVADLQMPSKKRKVSRLSDSRFVYKNLLLFLAWEQDPPVRFKTLGHEFRAMQLLYEAVYFLSKDSEFPVRVPLGALVDFKGFRVLAVSIIPIDRELTVVHGLKAAEYFLSDHSLHEHLSAISQLVNLKQQVFQWEGGIVPLVHLSVFTQAHLALGYEEIEDLEGHNEDCQYLYLTQSADLLPLDLDFNHIPSDYTRRIRPEFFTEYSAQLTSNGCINLTESAVEEEDYELCEASLQVRTDKISEIVELLDSLTIMPIDSKSFTQALHSNGINCRYIGLVAQRTALPHIKDLCYVEIVARTCKRIYFQQLVELVFEIEDPGGKVDNSEESKHNLPVVDIEGNYFRELEGQSENLDFSRENISNLEFRKHAFWKRLENQLKWPGYKELKEKIKESQAPSQNFTMEGSLKDGIIDYLNLVFGAGEESAIFWEEILLKKAAKHFSIPEDKLDKSQINLHALLHSVCFHCGLSIDFSKDTLLGKTENPFTPQSLERVKEKSRCVKLEGLENSVVQEMVKEVEPEDQAYETSVLMLKISKMANLDPEFLGDTVHLAQIGEILLERKEYEAAIQYAKDSLMQIHPLHAEGVKSWCILIRAMMASAMQDEALQCFDHALTALEYHWGPYHPLHCSLYSILAFLYMEKGNFEDSLILYKNSLMCSLRVLGPNHPHTAEVYIELGTLYVQQRVIPEAINAIEKGFFVYEAALGKLANATLTTAAKLALLHLENGNLEKTKSFVERVLNGYEKIVSGLVEEDEVDVGKVRNLVGKFEEGLEVAEKYWKNAGDSKFERTVRAKKKEMKRIWEKFL